jgi:hypothetical protein
MAPLTHEDADGTGDSGERATALSGHGNSTLGAKRRMA